MNLALLRKSNMIIYDAIGGSYAYGTNIPTSDKDVRGIFIYPKESYLGLEQPIPQISDDKQDITYYSLKRFFELIKSANPNLIELLWLPKDCVNFCSPLMKKLIDNRNIFISKKAYYTHSSYAFAQIKKCQGSNKKVHNPQPETMPKKEDFCWFIEASIIQGYREEIFPCRPQPLKDCSFSFSPGKPIDLSKCHASSVEHAQNVFRVYYYGDGAKGLFRGDDMMVCESIPKEDETDRFEGLLIYNKSEYEKAVKDWHSYWTWIKERNTSRWIDQEKGLLNYDQKNLMHTFRLLMSGENILRYGFPLVRFEGEQRDYLMRIRAGKFKYEELMAEVEKRMAKLEDLYKTSTIPNEVNQGCIEALYRDLTREP